MLAATLAFGLGISVTSCSDDDDDSKPSEGQETYEGLSTLEDDQLADLIAAWTDTGRDELNGTAWRNGTYEPTVGLVLDESQPGIRYVAVGTTEEADRYAASALGTLGIDYESPAGFSYSNGQVGTIAYSHSEGNTLGTISVSIRQIPVLQEIRLVKVLPDNADGKPYYKCGDIVKYKNRFYVCVSNHEYGQEARFITVNDQDTHTKGKFKWSGVGVDTVYNDDMAKAEVLGDWLQNVVCNGDMWNSVVSRMNATNNGKYTRQVVPEDNKIRTSLVNGLISEQSYMPELQHGNPLAGTGRMELSTYIWKNSVDEDDPAWYAPVGFLLADKLRWTLITDKWVPYIYMVKGEKTYNKVYDLELHQIPSQYKDASHFKFKPLNKFEITDKDQLIGMPSLETTVANLYNGIKADTYYVCVIGMHWTHTTTDFGHFQEDVILNFCRDYLYHPMELTREGAKRYPTDWRNRNITSRSLIFTDKGSKNKKYDNVSIQ